MRHLMTILLLLLSPALLAQNQQAIEAKRKAIAALERRIADEERAIGKIQKNRKTTEERTRRLARQIASRQDLLDETSAERDRVKGELNITTRTADSLQQLLDNQREQYTLLAREAYRGYRQNNYLSYLLSSRSFSDIARRLTTLREVATLREQTLLRIATLKGEVDAKQQELTLRNHQLDSISKRVSSQKSRLERDVRTAKSTLRQLNSSERKALARKQEQEEQLSVELSELRKLTKGNKEGASFSGRTSGLNLPVVGGRVKRYKKNMAEITGPKGARVRSIYEGKVVEVKQNRITAKWEVFVAHGEYITSYANLGAATIQKGQKVAKNGQIGTIGAAVVATTMQTEYKIVFGIYSPNPREEMSAAACFK